MTVEWAEVEKPAKAHALNLDTILRAAVEGNLALVECETTVEIPKGATVAVVCAVGWDGEEYLMTPFAVMLNGDPFAMLNPPDPQGGFHRSPRGR
jgi:hypothetical protein